MQQNGRRGDAEGLTRREFSRRTGLAALALGLGGCAPSPGLRGRKPNFVFILIDDLGWRDVGFMGSRYYRTPNLDRLAREGMVFTDAYAAAPNCAPSRACLLTGMYPPRHGIYTVNRSERGRARDRKLIPVPNTTELDPAFITVAEALREAGYVSTSIGKWHLGADPHTGPLSQGFDENVGGGRAGHPPTYFSPWSIGDLPDGASGEYLTDRLTGEAISFLERNREQPFFLYLTHYAVHTPIQAPEEIAARYRGQPGRDGQDDPVYAAMIERVDTGVGRILDSLETLGLSDETVIIFLSDNGGHGGKTSMEPLRGSKGMLYEGGIRSPMIVHWPGRIKAGSRCPEPVTMVDLMPTILELAGVPLPGSQPVDGESLIPLLAGGTALDRDAIYWHFPATWRPTPGWRGRGGRPRPAPSVRGSGN